MLSLNADILHVELGLLPDCRCIKETIVQVFRLLKVSFSVRSSFWIVFWSCPENSLRLMLDFHFRQIHLIQSLGWWHAQSNILPCLSCACVHWHPMLYLIEQLFGIMWHVAKKVCWCSLHTSLGKWKADSTFLHLDFGYWHVLTSK